MNLKALRQQQGVLLVVSTSRGHQQLQLRRISSLITWIMVRSSALGMYIQLEDLDVICWDVGMYHVGNMARDIVNKPHVHN